MLPMRSLWSTSKVPPQWPAGGAGRAAAGRDRDVVTASESDLSSLLVAWPHPVWVHSSSQWRRWRRCAARCVEENPRLRCRAWTTDRTASCWTVWPRRCLGPRWPRSPGCGDWSRSGLLLVRCDGGRGTCLLPDKAPLWLPNRSLASQDRHILRCYSDCAFHRSLVTGCRCIGPVVGVIEVRLRGEGPDSRSMATGAGTGPSHPIQIVAPESRTDDSLAA